MNHTFAILRNRWREVCFLFVLWVVENLPIKEQPATSDSDLAAGIMLLLGSVCFACFLLNEILSAGFARLAFLEGEKHQSLLSLWRAGIHFFWRLLGFTILWILAVFVATAVLRIPVTALAAFVTGINYVEMKKIITGPYVFLLSAIILMKPVMFVKAIIICRDTGIRAAWKQIEEFRILSAPLIPVLYLAMMVVTFINLTAFKVATAHSDLFFTATRILYQFISLVILLEATRVVSRVSSVSSSSTLTA